MDRRSSTSVIMAVLLVAACGSSSPSGSSDQGAPLPSASSAATTGSPKPSAAPITTGPAWTAVLGQVDADGHVTRDTALAAFALASGADMPGVIPPAGDPGTIASGTMALRWLVSYWDELTADQQAAAVAALPELAGLTRTSGVPGTATLAVARVPGAGARPPPAKVAQYRTDAYYTQLAKLKVADIMLHLPNDAPPFALAIDAHVGLTEKATSGMETGVYDAQGGKQGAPSKCVITVSWLGDAQTEIGKQPTHERPYWISERSQLLNS